ncbi:MAG: HAD-IIIA family hydrolase [Desulfotalea sp.]
MIYKVMQNIKAILMDVDGVLTDGSIVYDCKGNELKFFNVHDGFAINRAAQNGIIIYFITARSSEAVARRAQELGIRKVYQGAMKKADVLLEIVKTEGLSFDEIAYIGDDIVDLPIMKRVGLPIAVANACPEVKELASTITTASGGHGAVREAIEMILRQQGIWARIVSEYLR